MRYRIYNSEKIISTMEDMPYFANRFHGKDPNNPVNGVLEVDGKSCIIVGYEEIESERCAENEYHAIEREYFANVFVMSMASRFE